MTMSECDAGTGIGVCCSSGIMHLANRTIDGTALNPDNLPILYSNSTRIVVPGPRVSGATAGSGMWWMPLIVLAAMI